MRPRQRGTLVLPETVEAIALAMHDACRREGITRFETPYRPEKWEPAARRMLEATKLRVPMTDREVLAVLKKHSHRAGKFRVVKTRLCGDDGLARRCGWSYRRLVTALGVWSREGKLDWITEKGKGITVHLYY